MRTKTEHQQRVEKFMVLAKQELPDKPTMPDEKTLKLRAKLILEEAVETIHAMGLGVLVGEDKEWLYKNSEVVNMVGQDPDLEGIADGCADIIVVTTGTLSACGIADDSVQREVDENNLAKFAHECPRCGQLHVDEALTVAEIVSHIQPMTGGQHPPGSRRCLECGTTWQSGHHNEAGKWVKPANHKGPKIADVLKAQAKTDKV